ncbi:hypothetical protein SAMN05216480_102245 [Pustulibacterium marinum]|uniref:Uncharacterized protein n=1 Tax=Pustulibacterium marinum TaxID=1224947 RepID=A0A1I7FUH1_9FLAO|nr:glycosyltransferase family 4 protein [Pustulibacterium marinum]SFU39807.1 hypothetical protein SAMN05216480_102245 [Pustulibacterium marinum]
MQKVLIITYYWPPAGGPGVQRWLKFVKYFRDFGIEPIVYIPENPTYPMTDASFEAEVPEGITILKHPIFEPYALAGLLSKKKTQTISSGIIPTKKQSLAERLLLWVRGNLFIPDARAYWVKPSVRYLSNYIQEEGIETIVTTGPPHSLHLIGLQLQSALGVRWMADFRDPWTSIGYHSKLKLTKRSQAKHKALEKEVLQRADGISVTSYTTKKEFEALTTQPIKVITNGFDAVTLPATKLSDKFTLAHIGSLLSGRNPEALWQALQALQQEEPSFAADLEVVLAGKVSEEILETITAYGLKDAVRLPGYISHGEALQLQRESMVNLLIEIDSKETQGIIPGKLFEYMAAARPILAVGPAQWDAASIVETTQTGHSFLYTDMVAIKKQLLSWYRQYKAGELQVNPTDLEQFTRKVLTKKMAAYLASLH